MDDHRFDNVARSLGGGTTRRGVLRLLAAGAAGGFGAIAGSGAKAAPGGKGKPTKPPCCPTGYDALCTVGGRPTCIDTQTDAFNCGACGTSCPSGVCINGVCSTTVCTPGSTGASCTVGIGACQRTGTLICNADGSGYACDAVPGTPQPETCNGVDDDCDGLIDEDFNFAVDVNHCGGCNQVCQLPNATPACVNSTCQVATCHIGYADCDGRVDNGCETNTTSDVGSCGSCGKVCDAPREHGTVACVNSTCVVTCELGYHLAGTTNQPECVADASCDDGSNGGCHPVATCSDATGGTTCQCPAGYTGNGVGDDGCVDVDECVTNNPCSPNATCTNAEGSFSCTCNDGYTGNGVTCEPVTS